MSFSQSLKNELCSLEIGNRHHASFELYGLLGFQKSMNKSPFFASTKNQLIAQRVHELILRVFEVSCGVTSSPAQTSKASGLYLINIPEKYAQLANNQARLCKKIKPIHQAAFLRGAFLACGSITQPFLDYHLVFSVFDAKLANLFAEFLKNISRLEILPKINSRSNSAEVYIKNSEQITNLIAYMGAGKSAMNFIQTKMIKEVRNNINRTNNFETANIKKTAAAAAEQLQAIRKIQKLKKINFLPNDLKELVILRIKSPEMSLKNLGQALSPPLSRSGVNHRMQKIIEFANSLN